MLGLHGSVVRDRLRGEGAGYVSFALYEACMVLILGKKVCALLPPSLGPVIYVAVCVWPKYSILGLYVGTASGNKKTKYFKFQIWYEGIRYSYSLSNIYFQYRYLSLINCSTPKKKKMLNKKGEGIFNNMVTICEDISEIMYYV